MFERNEQLWKELDKISDKESNYYKSLKQLENKVFESSKTNSTKWWLKQYLYQLLALFFIKLTKDIYIISII